MGPGPKQDLDPNGPWAQTGTGPKRALGPNGRWAQAGAGPKRALDPNWPWVQRGQIIVGDQYDAEACPAGAIILAYAKV